MLFYLFCEEQRIRGIKKHITGIVNFIASGIAIKAVERSRLSIF